MGNFGWASLRLASLAQGEPPDWSRRCSGGLIPVEPQPVARDFDHHLVPLAEVAFDQEIGERPLDLLFDGSPQLPRGVLRAVALLGEEPRDALLVANVDRDARGVTADLLEEVLGDPLAFVEADGIEKDDLRQPVHELGAEVRLDGARELLDDLVAPRLGLAEADPVAETLGLLGADIRGEDDDRVAERNLGALVVGEESF